MKSELAVESGPTSSRLSHRLPKLCSHKSKLFPKDFFNMQNFDDLALKRPSHPQPRRLHLNSFNTEDRLIPSSPKLNPSSCRALRNSQLTNLLKITESVSYDALPGLRGPLQGNPYRVSTCRNDTSLQTSYFSEAVDIYNPSKPQRQSTLTHSSRGPLSNRSLVSNKDRQSLIAPPSRNPFGDRTNTNNDECFTFGHNTLRNENEMESPTFKVTFSKQKTLKVDSSTRHDQKSLQMRLQNNKENKRPTLQHHLPPVKIKREW